MVGAKIYTAPTAFDFIANKTNISLRTEKWGVGKYPPKDLPKTGLPPLGLLCVLFPPRIRLWDFENATICQVRLEA